MDLAAVREDIAIIDLLLREVANRPVDLSDPDWMRKLRAGPRPAEQAGVAVEAAAALETLLDAYENGDERTREEVREIFQAHHSFSWGVGLPREWMSAAEFRRRLILVSARDRSEDPRDTLMQIWGLCNQARELGLDVEPVLREVAGMSSKVEHVDFGSMRFLLMRGLEEHDVR